MTNNAKPVRAKDMDDLIDSTISNANVRQFTKNASLMYGRKWFTDSGRIERLVDFAQVGTNDLITEFACGAGVVASRLSKDANFILGLDITPKMIELAKENAARQSLANVDFRVADCFETGLEDDYCNVSLMRSGLHHFYDPVKLLKEMRRVTKKSAGKIIIEDTLSPSDELGSFYRNTIERLRDPSHAQMFSLEGIRSLFDESGIKLEKVELSIMERDFQDWMEQASPTGENYAKCKSLIEQDVDRNMTGLAPRYDNNGRLVIHITEMFLQGSPAV